MIILGLWTGHDAAVCILRDGKVVLNLELERFSRIRHDYGYDHRFLDFCLKRAGIGIGDVDHVAANFFTMGDPADLNCRPGTVFCPAPFAPPLIDQIGRFELTLLGRDFTAIGVNHHAAHIAAAAFTAPFENTAVLSLDGGGDQYNFANAACKGGALASMTAGNRSNLGMLWQVVSIVNYHFGRSDLLRPSSGPGKIMALAAHGAPDGVVSSDFMARVMLGDAIGNVFEDDLSDTRSRRSQDYARALQDVTEIYVETLIRVVAEKNDSRRMCYAGGLALNCVANARAARSGALDELHVPPCPHDGGLALGAALMVHHAVLGEPYEPGFFSPYTGPVYSEGEIAEAIGAAEADGADWTVEDATDAKLVERLADGAVVAFWRQRSECGPRALGHRSLICRPDADGVRDFINQQVKLREWFRPFAPIILDDAAEEVLEGPVQPSPYMTTSAVIREEWRERAAGVLHVDNSTRPQILKREHEPWLHGLLSEYRRATGLPMVLNTSFNRQEPIVESPKDAIKTFLEAPIGALLLDNRLITKRNT